MSLLETSSDVKSNCIKPKQVLALNKTAINENAAWTLNWANQYIAKQIFTNTMMGKPNPKNANIQKWLGEIYLEAIALIKLTIKT